MNVYEKIDNFIDYNSDWNKFTMLPYNQDVLDVFNEETPTMGSIITEIFMSFFGGGTPTITKTALDYKSNVWLDYSKANIWGNTLEILPLEGVSVVSSYFSDGVVGDTIVDIQKFIESLYITDGSILNLPSFIDIFHKSKEKPELQNDLYYYFLSSLPHNPPFPKLAPLDGMPIKKDATEEKHISSVTDNFEENPSMLFKNSAGIYSLPKTYVDWLGGMQLFNDEGSIQLLKQFTRIIQNSGGTFSDVKCSIDENKKSTDFFIVGNYDTYLSDISEGNTILVDFDKIMLYRHSELFVERPYSSVAKFAKSDYMIDPINGLGIYSDLVYNIYNEIIDDEILKSTNEIIELDIISRLRVFNTYKYRISDDVQFNSYGIYSTLNYNPDISDMKAPTIDSNAFSIYSYLWKYMYDYLKEYDYNDSNINYQQIKSNILTGSPDLVSSDKIKEINTKLFFDTGVEDLGGLSELDTEIIDYDVIDNTNMFTSDKDSFDYLLDKIGSLVLLFIKQNDYKIKQSFINTYNIRDEEDVFMIYPSGGGMNSIAYAIKQINEKLGGDDSDDEIKTSIIRHPGKPIKVQDGQDSSDFVSKIFIDIMNNNCHWLWYTGPYAGFSNNMPVDTDEVLSNDKYQPLESLNYSFLYHKDEFTAPDATITKDDRCYIMDNVNIFHRQDGTLDEVVNMDYDTVKKYIGERVLDGCKDNFITNTIDVKTMLYSLLILDRKDFGELTLDGVEYKVDEQLEYLALYNNLLAFGYETGEAFIKPKKNTPNIFKVMNASLTNAQQKKAKRLITDWLSERKLLNIGSVFDYVHSDGIYNMFHNVISYDVQRSKDDGAYVRKALFGEQKIEPFQNINDYPVEYTGFFIDINVQPDENTIKICKDFLELYLSYDRTKLTYLADQIEVWISISFNDLRSCIDILNEEFEDIDTIYNAQKYEKEKNRGKNELGILKMNTYYNVKALFDNWITVNNEKNEFVLSYNLDSVPYKNELAEKANPKSLFSQFLFLDRANRNIGNELLVNLNWLNNFFKNNFGYSNQTNISLYTFLSDLAKEHASVIHSLPAFINLGQLNYRTDSADFAGQLFETYDYVDLIDSTPQFIFQFIGNTNSILNLPTNKELRSNSKSYLLSNVQSHYDTKTNSIVNIKDSISGIPKDLKDSSGAVSFVVNFGAQEQQMFTNLQVDQSEYQNTEEFYQLITDLANNQTKTQSGDLFTIFTERSYTATVDSLGNLMIQPLMFFDLVNIPMFYGNYWITNVKHRITPNDITTTFKGVRQPVAFIPTRKDVLLQLSTGIMNNLFGIPKDFYENVNVTSLTSDTRLSEPAPDGRLVILPKSLTSWHSGRTTDFVELFYPYALKMESIDSINAVFRTAQAALESGWGGSDLAQEANNLFGIKADSSWSGSKKSYLTLENSYKADATFGDAEIISITPAVDDAGKTYYVYKIRTDFRLYPTPAGSFEDHGQFFYDNNRYSQALLVKTDAKKFATAVANAGYATDIDYENKLHTTIDIIEGILS